MTTVEKATEAFNGFAAIAPPDLPSNPLDAIQVRLHRWQIARFGWQVQEWMVMGIVEELGELDDAVNAEQRMDAVGDVCIYTSQLLTHNRLALSEVVAYAERIGSPRSLISAAGILCHVVLKRLQSIRGMTDDRKFRESVFLSAAGVMASSMTLYNHHRESDGDLTAIISLVSEHVMTRTGKMLPA